jgi:hypothetical protein
MNVNEVYEAWRRRCDELDIAYGSDNPTTQDIIEFTLEYFDRKFEKEISKVIAIADHIHLCTPKVYTALVHLLDEMKVEV